MGRGQVVAVAAGVQILVTAAIEALEVDEYIAVPDLRVMFNVLTIAMVVAIMVVVVAFQEWTLRRAPPPLPPPTRDVQAQHPPRVDRRVQTDPWTADDPSGVVIPVDPEPPEPEPPQPVEDPVVVRIPPPPPSRAGGLKCCPPWFPCFARTPQWITRDA